MFLFYIVLVERILTQYLKSIQNQKVDNNNATTFRYLLAND